MSSWIEVEPLIEAHYQHCNENHGEADVFYTWSLELMRKAPSIDLVRCAECKYWQDNNGGYPTTECRWGKDETPDADDFCSYGERRASR